MGHWGVKSYENDDAGDALDAGFEAVHGEVYDDLMDDDNPLTPEQVQQKLANTATLAEAIKALVDEINLPTDEWDESAQLAYAGIVVRHAELNVPLAAEVRDRALTLLKEESIEWDEATARRLRRDKEIRLLESAKVDG
jgi:alkylation response protein AidB-like acyl-CoA dehydrogenase